MNIILSIPLAVRLPLLFGLGALAAGWINLAVYRLAWNQRLVSPWSAPPVGRTPHWLDRVPLVGWLALRRESPQQGRGFWIRPLGVELLAGFLFAGLYYWEVTVAAPQPPVAGQVLPPAQFLSTDLPLVLHVRYLSHLILLSLMLVASLIDIDEKTIPDSITVTGTLLGLAMALAYPWSLLSAGEWLINGAPQVEFLTFASPGAWPSELDAWPVPESAAIAVACWTLWCGGLLPRRWNQRRGLTTAVRVFIHRLRAESITYRVLAMWLAGGLAIVLAWRLAPAAHWAGVLTALVGMAAGGGMIWAVRIIGSATLRREAMGFGDVTLMAMIGAFVGWQASLIVFFLAPFAGLVVGLAQWISHREHEVPYGPFLCLATFGLLLAWNGLWDRLSDIFALGGLLVALMFVCLALMGLMLWAYRLVLSRLNRGR